MDGNLLIIVESPSKIKTLKKYIPNAVFDASIGHVCDLPSTSMGLTDDLKPIYETTKPDVIAKIKAKMPGRTVVLMTDLDREGEAISYHLQRLLGLGDNYIRVVSQALTKPELEKAFKKARKIDMNMVTAQECRRVADRLIGYRVSNYTRNLLDAPSAGRVQSVALKLLVEREKLIAAFNKTPYLELECTHMNESTNELWTSSLDIESIVSSGKFKDFLSPEVPNKSDKDRKVVNVPFMQAIQKNVFAIGELFVHSSDTSNYKTKAPAPFTSSKLIQAASTQLGFATETTMNIAQKLFEKGIITYHRSDSTYIEPDSILQIRNFIDNWQNEHNLTGYLPSSQNFHSQSEHAQAGHEAVRPTDLYRSTNDMNDQERALYLLIHSQTIASQMAEAEFQKVSMVLDTGISVRNHPLRFVASGRTRLFDGWQSFVKPESKNEELIPNLNHGDKVRINNMQLKRKFTKAPSRYTEAKLIDEIDKRGIGRPATYLSIIKTLINRKYAKRNNEYIECTHHGIKLVDALDGHFSFMDYTYTANSELEFDNVAHGKMNYDQVIHKLNADLDSEINNFVAALGTKISFSDCPSCQNKTLIKRKAETPYFQCISEPCNKRFSIKNGVLAEFQQAEESDITCPRCKKLKLKISRKDSIYCYCTKQCGYVSEATESEGKLELQTSDSNENCPICLKQNLRRIKSSSDDSYYWLCTNCKNSYGDTNGAPNIKGIFKCPNCKNGKLILSSKKEWFYCTNNKTGTCNTFLRNNGEKPELPENGEIDPKATKHKCPNCEHLLIYRPMNDNFMCENFKNCRTVFSNKEGMPNYDELKLKQRKPFI
ncbi:TPA: type IA DNA topoisomerase [Vibrio cholerae]